MDTDCILYVASKAGNQSTDRWRCTSTEINFDVSIYVNAYYWWIDRLPVSKALLFTAGIHSKTVAVSLCKHQKILFIRKISSDFVGMQT